jgi:ABC-type transporter MlaC component
MKPARIRLLGIALLIVLVVRAAPAATPPGLADIHARIDRIVTLLQAPGLTQAQRRRAILAEAEPAFDWREMARAALGPSWQQRTPAQRAEFTRLFQALVEHAYLARVLQYHGERVVYGQQAVHRDEALLRTQIVRPNRPSISVDYELLRRGDRWLVIDVLVEHVGLVSNYRSQIAAILSRSSYPHLIAKMRAQAAGPA